MSSRKRIFCYVKKKKKKESITEAKKKKSSILGYSVWLLCIFKRTFRVIVTVRSIYGSFCGFEFVKRSEEEEEEEQMNEEETKE